MGLQEIFESVSSFFDEKASCDSDRKLKDLADVKEIVKNAEVDKFVLQKLLIKYGLEEYYESIIG